MGQMASPCVRDVGQHGIGLAKLANECRGELFRKPETPEVERKPASADSHTGIGGHPCPNVSALNGLMFDCLLARQQQEEQRHKHSGQEGR